MTKITTTLNRIKKHDPCQEGWRKLLAFLNKTEADDEELNILTILESNGVKDCVWAFQCTENHDSIYRHIAADFAESVLHIYENYYPNDNRPRLAIQAARDYADGKISDAELAAAMAAARAAMAAAWAAFAAADSTLAARDAMAAAWAARAALAAWAARDAALAARDAYAAARYDGWDAELEKQKQIILKYLSC